MGIKMPRISAADDFVIVFAGTNFQEINKNSRNLQNLISEKKTISLRCNFFYKKLLLRPNETKRLN